MIATTIETTELGQLLYNLGIDPPKEGDVTEVSHEEVVTQNGDGAPEKHETDETKIQHEDGSVETETHHDGVESNHAVDPGDDGDESEDHDEEEKDGDDELAEEDEYDDLDYEEDEADENENDEHEIEAGDDVDEPDTDLDAEKDQLSGPANDLIGQPSHHTNADDK